MIVKDRLGDEVYSLDTRGRYSRLTRFSDTSDVNVSISQQNSGLRCSLLKSNSRGGDYQTVSYFTSSSCYMYTGRILTVKTPSPWIHLAEILQLDMT